MPSEVQVARVSELDRLFDLEPAEAEGLAKACDKVFRANETKLFESEGKDGGAPWKPLSPEYKAWKDRWFSGAPARARSAGTSRSSVKRGYGENKILQLTGQMKRAFTTLASSAHIARALKDAGDWVIHLGARSDVAKYHEEGSTRLPRRSPIQMTDGQKRDLVNAMREQLEKVLRVKVPKIARAMRIAGRA